MKTILTLCLCLAATLSALADARLDAVQAADDARIAAFRSPDKDKLDALFSDELRYAHSSGTIDTKASFIELLTSGKTRYQGIDIEDRSFTFPAPGIALMTGRSRIQVESANGKMDSVLSYLAV